MFYFRLRKKKFQKKFFVLGGPAPYPPPTLSGRATKKITFFAASLGQYENSDEKIVNL